MQYRIYVSQNKYIMINAFIKMAYTVVSDIRRTKYKNLNHSRLIL